MKYSEYLKDLYRPALEKTKTDDYICLEKNEPPFSAFETIDNIFNDEDMKNLRVYPNLYDLYEQLADFSSVDINNIFLTQGSEQALKNVFEVFVEEGDEVIYYTPSFAMYDVFAFQKKAKVTHLHFDENGDMNLEDILSSVTKKTRLFSLINPHNFTGKSIDFESLKRVVEHTEKTDTIFLLDEAYYHYFCLDSTSFIRNFKHVIITRTFSKALGIPGARVGYALATQENIELLRKVKPIDEIDYLAGVIAKKVLKEAPRILDKNVKQVQKWQEIFKNSELKDIKYIDTYANFILLKSSNYEYHKAVLLNNKIVPKLDFDIVCLKDCIRFSVVDDDTMNMILGLFKK